MFSTSQYQRLFLISGPILSWLHMQPKGLWGLPSRGCTWAVARRHLQQVGFGSASHFIACAGPRALFHGVVDGDVHFDDSNYLFDRSGPEEPYAVRFRFTAVRKLDGVWCPEITSDGRSWRTLVRDVYLDRRSLYRLQDSALTHPEVRSRLDALDLDSSLQEVA
ncbi:MAG: hypothetical protein KF729_33770 [Sandaracinaceae bacterium]|nr:hypothetical protein [Sandaracinaceae bacterium]